MAAIFNHSVYPRRCFDCRCLNSGFRPAALNEATRNPETEYGNGNGNGIRNTESRINDRELKNFTLYNVVQSKENLF